MGQVGIVWDIRTPPASRKWPAGEMTAEKT
jgi:hypothetical protein